MVFNFSYKEQIVRVVDDIKVLPCAPLILRLTK
jgi:hypothetical protein